MAFYVPRAAWRRVGTDVGKTIIRSNGPVRIFFGDTPGPTDGFIVSYHTRMQHREFDLEGADLWIQSAVQDPFPITTSGRLSAVWVEGATGTLEPSDILPRFVFADPSILPDEDIAPSIGALTPADTAPLAVTAPNGVYHGGSLAVTDNQLTIVAGQTPTPATVVINGIEINVVANRYDVTSDAEFANAFARSDEQLSGTIVHVRDTELSRSTISDISPVEVVKLETGGGASIDGLSLSGTVSNFEDASYKQLRAWPATHDCVRFETNGTFSNITFKGGRLRHGYGPNNEDFDSTVYGEYTRVDNVVTATTTSQTFPLNWQDEAATSGQVFSFNRGTEDVYIVVGGPSVTATVDPANLLEPTDRFKRFTQLDPTTDTHFAVVTQTGTSEVNGRSEIGLSYYLGDGITTAGGSVFNGVVVEDNDFEDLENGNGASMNGGSGETIVFNNRFMRVYQDWWKLGGGTLTGIVRFINNVGQVPFSKSGIDEDRDGHAGDPHGDILQLTSTPTNPGGFDDLIFWGNIVLPSVIPGGNRSQGIYGTLEGTEGFRNIYIGASILPFSASNATSLGFEGLGQGVEHQYIYGVTVASEDFNDQTRINVFDNMPPSHNFVGGCIAEGFGNFPGANLLVEYDNHYHSTLGTPYDIWPDYDARLVATTREEMIAAMTPSAIHAGKGADLIDALVDFDANTWQEAILWENTHPGVGWGNRNSVPDTTMQTFTGVKVLAGPTAMPVVPGAGVEVQVLGTDNSTVITPWTSVSTTADRGQFLQMRMLAGGPSQTVVARVTISGFDVDTQITSSSGLLFTTADDAGTSDPTHFTGPAIGAGVSAVRVRMRVNLPSIVSNMVFAEISGNAFVLEHTSGGIRIRVRDDGGTSLLSSTVLDAGSNNVSAATGNVTELDVYVDLATDLARLTVDGIQYPDLTMVTGSGLLRADRLPSLLADLNGSDPLPLGTGVELIELYYGTASNLTLVKTIEGLPATVATDPWLAGGAPV